MLEVPDSLVERLKARQVVLVAGLGCSELANAPGWIGLTDALATHLVFSDARQAVARLTAAGRLLDAVAFIRDMVPHPVVEEALKAAYPNGLPIPENVQQFAQFPWRAVVTTAFDDLWERALAAARGGHLPPTVSVATEDPVKAQKAGSASVPLLHLYGRVALPESLVIGPGDARTRLTGSPGSPGWTTSSSADRSCSSAFAPAIRTCCGCRRGWPAARTRACPTSCFWTSRRKPTRTPRCPCGGCGPASKSSPAWTEPARRSIGWPRSRRRSPPSCRRRRPTSTSASGWIAGRRIPRTRRRATCWRASRPRCARTSAGIGWSSCCCAGWSSRTTKPSSSNRCARSRVCSATC